jgi:hypothetical protein
MTTDEARAKAEWIQSRITHLRYHDTFGQRTRDEAIDLIADRLERFTEECWTTFHSRDGWSDGSDLNEAKQLRTLRLEFAEMADKYRGYPIAEGVNVARDERGRLLSPWRKTAWGVKTS